MTNSIMTNATLVILIVTNWTHFGTFIDKTGTNRYTVQEGQIFTNTVGRMTHETQSVEFTFKSIPGPILDAKMLCPYTNDMMGTVKSRWFRLGTPPSSFGKTNF